MGAKRKKIIQPKNLLEGLGWIVGLTVAFFVAIYLTAGLERFAADHGILQVGGNLRSLLVQCVVYAVMTAIVLAAAVALRRKITLKDAGLQRMADWRDIGMAVAGFFAYFLLALGLIFLARQIPGYDADQAQDVGLSERLFSTDLLVAFLVLVVVAPFFEELIFRGVLYGKLRAAKISFLVATIIVSLLFAFAHGQWNVGVDVFALSVVSCFLREKTGSIWAGFLLHVIKNLIAFYIKYVFVGTQL